MFMLMLFLSPPPPPRMGGGDRKEGDNEGEEVFRRRPSPSCPCLDDPDDAGITVLEEEECDDFEEARIVRR